MYFMLYLDCISRIKKSTFGARIFLPRLFFFGFMYLALCVSKMKFSEWHFDSFNVKQHVHIYYYCIHWMLMLACYKFMQFHRFHPSLLNDENLWKKIIQSFFPFQVRKKKKLTTETNIEWSDDKWNSECSLNLVSWWNLNRKYQNNVKQKPLIFTLEWACCNTSFSYLDEKMEKEEKIKRLPESHFGEYVDGTCCMQSCCFIGTVHLR